MSFRKRLTLAAAIAVAIAVALASALAYVLVRNQLRGQVDDALSSRAAGIERIQLPEDMPGSDYFGRLPHGRLGDVTLVQFVTDSGIVVRPGYESFALPVSRRTREVASGESGAFFSDDRVNDVHVRVLTLQLRPGLALQLVRSLEEVDHVLGRLGLILALVAASGVGVAVAIGGIVAAAALRPVRRLSEVTEHVAATRDLSQRLEETGNDELGRLARSFNTMMAALEESQRAQRQLVADASHELRTPLTALRTNVELLAGEGLPYASPEDRRLLNDVVAQLEELTVLVGDLVELARGSDQVQGEAEDVRLDLLTAAAVERAARNSPATRFETRLEPTLVRGVPGRIDRAVANLLDNAAKWSPEGAIVEVAAADGEVTVRDYGPGIAEADMPFIFDRFYRAKTARGMPGSGLGLAIVRQVAETHGGSVAVEAALGGGSRFRLRFPTVAVERVPEPEPVYGSRSA